MVANAEYRYGVFIPMKGKVLLFVATAMLSACGGSSSSTTTEYDLCGQLTAGGFSCSGMVENLYSQQQSRIANFAQQVETLRTDVTSYCQAVDNGSNQAATRTTAQASFEQAALIWQQLDVMQFGALNSDTRDQFYTYPTRVSCPVNGSIASGGALGATPDQRGLTALEYILYSDEPRGCSDALPDASDPQKRCDYGLKVAEQLVLDTQALQADAAAYQPSLGQPQQEVQQIFNGLLYVYNETKEAKLQKSILPEKQDDRFKASALEYPVADINRAAIEANLTAASVLMNGDSGSGLADLLVAAGQDGLADDMTASLQRALSASESQQFSESWRSILTDADSDPFDNDVDTCLATPADAASDSSQLVRLCSLSKKIDDFSDYLKGPLALTLSLRVPGNVEDDGD